MQVYSAVVADVMGDPVNVEAGHSTIIEPGKPVIYLSVQDGPRRSAVAILTADQAREIADHLRVASGEIDKLHPES